MSGEQQTGRSQESSDAIAKARFVLVSGGGKSKAETDTQRADDDSLEVHFNPASLEYTLTNNLAQGGGGAQSKQQTAQSSAKLSMQLLFDTTDTGHDVRRITEKLHGFMMPPEAEKKKKQGKGKNKKDENVPVASVVRFEWGTYTFTGMIDSYKEALEFFSATGVPLRASINLSMTQQDKVFAKQSTDDKLVVQGSFKPAKGVVPEQKQQQGFGLSVGLSIRASLGTNGPAFGARASAGVPASLGAFAGLRAVVPRTRIGDSRALELAVGTGQRFRPPGRDAAFGPGGRAVVSGSSGLRADVGARASLSRRMRFDEE